MNTNLQKFSTTTPKTLPIVLASLLLGLSFNWLFVDNVPGISVLIYASLVLGLTFYLTKQFKRPLNKSIYWLAPVILFFAAMVFVRANPFLAVMDILVILYLLILVARLSHRPDKKISQFSLLQYSFVTLTTPLRFIFEFLAFLPKLISSRPTPSKSAWVPIARGILLSLPILGVFLLLLSSADLVFRGYITSLVNLSISPETVFRWILVGFITSLFTGAYAYIFMPTTLPEINASITKKRFYLGSTEAAIILGSVSVLFLAFVMVQLAYLFGGSAQIASTTFTYAEYARKGFFELIAVATISLLLIMTIKNVAKFRTQAHSKVFKWLSTLLVAEVMIIMLSAHLRLNLYEVAYGFTSLRLFSHLFIVWLAVAFAALLIHIKRGASENKFVFQLFLGALCFIALINIINPDNFIARQNISRFNKVGKIDLHYLRSLSKDSAPAMAELLDHPNHDLQKAAANILYKQKHTDEYISNWPSANLARQRAEQIFRQHAAQIEAGKSHGEYRELNVR